MSANRTIESGKPVVTCFAVERLGAATAAGNADWEVLMIEVTMQNGLYLVA